jgi:hypothetical protein
MRLEPSDAVPLEDGASPHNCYLTSSLRHQEGTNSLTPLANIIEHTCSLIDIVMRQVRVSEEGE